MMMVSKLLVMEPMANSLNEPVKWALLEMDQESVNSCQHYVNISQRNPNAPALVSGAARSLLYAVGRSSEIETARREVVDPRTRLAGRFPEAVNARRVLSDPGAPARRPPGDIPGHKGVSLCSHKSSIF